MSIKSEGQECVPSCAPIHFAHRSYGGQLLELLYYAVNLHWEVDEYRHAIVPPSLTIAGVRFWSPVVPNA